MKRYYPLLKEEKSEEDKWLATYLKFSDQIDDLDSHDFDLNDSTLSCSIKVDIEDIRDMIRYESLFRSANFSLEDVDGMNDKTLLEILWKNIYKENIEPLKDKLFSDEYESTLYNPKSFKEINYEYNKSRKEFTINIEMYERD